MLELWGIMLDRQETLLEERAAYKKTTRHFLKIKSNSRKGLASIADDQNNFYIIWAAH